MHLLDHGQQRLTRRALCQSLTSERESYAREGLDSIYGVTVHVQRMVFPVVQVMAAVADAGSGAIDGVLSATDMTFSMSDKPLSDMDQTFSMTDGVLSAADTTFSVTDGVLHAVTMACLRTDKPSSGTDNTFSMADKPLSVMDTTFSTTDQTPSMTDQTFSTAEVMGLPGNPTSPSSHHGTDSTHLEWHGCARPAFALEFARAGVGRGCAATAS